MFLLCMSMCVLSVQEIHRSIVEKQKVLTTSRASPSKCTSLWSLNWRFWCDIDTKSKTLFRMREQLPIPTLKRLIWTLLKIPASPYLNMTTESSGLQLFYHIVLTRTQRTWRRNFLIPCKPKKRKKAEEEEETEEEEEGEVWDLVYVKWNSSPGCWAGRVEGHWLLDGTDQTQQTPSKIGT